MSKCNEALQVLRKLQASVPSQPWSMYECELLDQAIALLEEACFLPFPYCDDCDPRCERSPAQQTECRTVYERGNKEEGKP